MEIQKLCHKKFGEIRVLHLNGKFYFVGRDVANSLGFKDASKAVTQHVQAEDKFTISQLAEQSQIRSDNLACQAQSTPPDFTGSKIAHNAIWINESGLYSLVLHSTLPLAKEFQHWVTAEVLPSIREKGYYINPYAPTAPPAPVPEVPENELSRFDKIKILRELLDYTDCKNLRNKLIYDIACLVTNKNY